MTQAETNKSGYPVKNANYWRKQYQLIEGEHEKTGLIIEELTDALKELMSVVRIHSEATNTNFAWAEMEEAEKVLNI